VPLLLWELRFATSRYDQVIAPIRAKIPKVRTPNMIAGIGSGFTTSAAKSDIKLAP